MPQMAPLNWLTLFLYFMIIFLMMNSLNYFSFIYEKEKKNELKNMISKTNWKW